ncbi:hypothetical protein L5515_011899 [Caenorhabditis briggsae]|uniref:Uncharacterized protein n=1 Tax=Caenorhabditis briggsae TaxID=6238 RepID=A0AAE9ER70_CAEBR|nr:hypothetical protein L5515_011899 [Caenorhabditis briggsae]
MFGSVDQSVYEAVSMEFLTNLESEGKGVMRSKIRTAFRCKVGVMPEPKVSHNNAASAAMSDILRFISGRIGDYEKQQTIKDWTDKVMKEIPHFMYTMFGRTRKHVARYLAIELNRVEKLDGFSLMEKLQLAFMRMEVYKNMSKKRKERDQHDGEDERPMEGEEVPNQDNLKCLLKNLARLLLKNSISKHAWQETGEVSSASNCTDFQARRLGIKYKTADGTTKYVHTCNGTALPSTRTLISVLETFQNDKKGIGELPDPLRKRIATWRPTSVPAGKISRLNISQQG